MDHNPERTDQHELSEKQANTEEHKGKTAVAAVLDPTFPLPALTEESTAIQYVLSFGTLFILLGGALGGAWLYGVEILQGSQPLLVNGCVFAAMIGAFAITGTIWIDWFELVIGYWWLSMPIGAFAGLIIMLKTEAETTLAETQ